MLVKIIRILRGYVDFEVKGKFPERFLNLTARYGINIWNALPASGGLNASMTVSDYRKIRAVARKSKVTSKITSKHGLPFIVDRYKPRVGLAVGAAVGLILIFVLSNFVWSIGITGTSRISDEYLREVLAENGVSVGAYKGSIDVQSAERSTALSISEISWMSVNIKGSVINVEIKEKAEKPQFDTSTAPCNIKASSDGVITKINASSGEIKVLKGSGVAKGDLLVSGILETKMETVEYVRAQAEVYANVISEKEFNLPRKYVYYSLSDNKINRNRLEFLNFDFPCSISFEAFENSVSNTFGSNLYCNGVVLPLGIKTQTTYELEEQNISLDPKSARKAFENEMLLYEIFTKPQSTVVDRNTRIIKKGDEYVCIVEYTFNENIAQQVEFSVQ